MPEVAGKGALLVDPFSVQSIKEGIQKICSNSLLRTQLIVAGYANTQRFLPAQVAGQYLEIYKSLLP